MQYSIVRYSEVKENSDFRIDSEFYSKEFLDVVKAIESKKFIFNRDASVIKSGTTPKNRDSELKQGVVLLKTGNIRNDVLIDQESDNLFYIDENENLKMSSTTLRENDVLINIVGATTDVVGRVAMIFKDFPKSNITQAMALCRIKTNLILPEYLFTFLKSYYGKTQVKYISRPTGQYNLNLQEVGYVRIPTLDLEFQNKISFLIKASYELKKSSKSLYTEAENLLLEEVGLKNWQPKHQLTYIKNYSDTQKAERFDAEYFQPQYEKVEDSLKNYSLGYSFVKDEFKHVKDVFKTNSEKIYQYVEIGSVNVSNSEITPENILGSELPANAKRKLSKNQVIISKVRTYRGAISIVDNEDYVGSGAFTVLEEKTDSKLNKETLLVLLKSKPLLAWSLKPNTGTSYPVIIDSDILNLPLPLIPKNIQVQIKSNIEKSNLMRGQSKLILDLAKKAVEMAIENNEEQATNWINQELERLGVRLSKE